MTQTRSGSGDNPLLDAALAYANRGWAVFPLNGKLPYRGSHGHKDATTSPSQIKRWWAEHPSANIGIACSSDGAGPIVLDVDGPEGERAATLLGLPQTREATSGRPHRHHYYFAPPESGVVVKRKLKVRPDLDVLGNGGYVVAPPSIHPKTGKPYVWTSRAICAPLPENIVKLARPETKNGHGDHGGFKNADKLPNVLKEGNRDNLLTSLAGSMRRRGASEASILAALREENANRCVPPLDDAQLRKIARSIGAKEPAGKITENLTDLGNARRFITQHHADLRHVKSWKKAWLSWDGFRWASDETGEAERRAKETVRQMHVTAIALADESERDSLLGHAIRSEGSNRISGMLNLAATEPEIVCTASSLDRNPWQLNLKNGTIDLMNGKRHEHRREDLLTKLAPVTYERTAQAPRWAKFLREITNNDPQLIGFLRRAIGYTLTGDTSEQCLFFCYGKGANGKTTFLEVLRALFGDYAQQADFNTFLARSSEGPRNDLARMRGARLVTAVEAQGDKAFDESVLKMITGSDTIVARRLYEEFFEFLPTHKLWLAANHKPQVKDHTLAFWRRIKLVPFIVTFPKSKQDSELKEKLIEELPGILNWALTGCQRWIDRGLDEPDIVKVATKTYKEETDIAGEFIQRCCTITSNGWTSNADMFRAFTEWYIETHGGHARTPSPVWVGRMLAERDELRPGKQGGIRGWMGVNLK